MSDLEQNIIGMLEKNPGLSDKELADIILGYGQPPKYINENCRRLVAKGIISRKKRDDGIIGNWLKITNIGPDIDDSLSLAEAISDKKIKQVLDGYLKSLGWEPRIAWGFTHGIDIEAINNKRRWIIEVKGGETPNLLPASMFVSVIGEVIQRMDDPHCKYSVALPDITQFRRLWGRLPALAKERTEITALLIGKDGKVEELLS